MSDHQDAEDEFEQPVSNCKAQLQSCLQLPIILATVSLLLNAVFASAWLYPHLTQPHKLATDKEWNQFQPWIEDSIYFSKHHQTRNDQQWAAMDWASGVVAISDSEANELGLPKSQRFPWDESKGIYLINAYHNLHCLSFLWKSLAGFRDGKPFELGDYHGFHCLDQLRQDTICYADDTPRYTGGRRWKNTSGYNQTRQCRDWSRLERWAKERTGCYRYLNETAHEELDRYKFCPRDSPYNEVIEEIYGANERQRLVKLYGPAAA